MFCYKYNVGDTVYCFDFSEGVVRKCEILRQHCGNYFITYFSERKDEDELATRKDVLLKRLRKQYDNELSEAKVRVTLLSVYKDRLEKEMDKYGIKYPKLEE